MKKRLLKLYSENINEFIKFITKFYGEEELQLALSNVFKPEECYFIIAGQLTSIYTIIEHVEETIKQYKVLQEFNIVDTIKK